MEDVTSFIDKLKQPWQQQICAELLDVISKTAPEIKASIKWQNPFFEYNGAVLK